MNDAQVASGEQAASLQAAGSARKRSYDRAYNKMRPVKLTRQVMKNADGSCLVEFGDTRVLCAATVEENVPRWRRGQGSGWVTAEYAMLPASTSRRTPREYKGRKGRSMEIERLVGRSLRTVTDLGKLGEYTVTVDCDVIQADGGTRTASITGGWVALHDALMSLVERDILPRLPLTGQVAAISMGLVGDDLLLDLDYPEDSHASVDMNLVGTGDGRIVEIQGTGEKTAFDRDQLNQLLDMGQAAIAELVELQNRVTHFR
jgi:ribonuclease PH